MEAAAAGKIYPRVAAWSALDARRILPVPADHWLLVEDAAPFRATLEAPGAGRGTPKAGTVPMHVQSVQAGDIHVACFPPMEAEGDGDLCVERYSASVTAAWRGCAWTWAGSIPNMTACSEPACIRRCRWTGMCS
jgi:hypothetical protein